MNHDTEYNEEIPFEKQYGKKFLIMWILVFIAILGINLIVNWFETGEVGLANISINRALIISLGASTYDTFKELK